MESRVKLLGHPAHQIAVSFPLGLLATAALFDAVYQFRGGPTWSLVGFYMIGAGLVGGVVAALFGIVDYRAIPARTRARRIGLFHGLSSFAVLCSFTASWILRFDAPTAPPPVSMLFSFGGAALLGLAGWFGGELVNRLGVGIDDDASLDAPSSLSGPACLPTTLRGADSARTNL